MKTILFVTLLLFSSLNTIVLASEEKCSAFDIKCKAKKFAKDTADFQKKGLKKSKKQIGENTKKILKAKDIVVDDVKDTVDGFKKKD